MEYASRGPEEARRHRPVGGDALPQEPDNRGAREALLHREGQDEAGSREGARRTHSIVQLELEGGTATSNVCVRDFMDAFLRYKEGSKTIEPSTVRSYRAETKQICHYLGDVRLSALTVADVNGWMARMTADSYAPKSVAKPFRLLKQALKWAMSQDLVRKNVCEFCKPPKWVKTPINALDRAARTRMLRLAVAAEATSPLGLAIELTLTTGMRRGEVCALRWSDVGGDGTVTVSHALGNGEDGFYLKEPKTGSSARTIPLTAHTAATLRAKRADSRRVLAKMGVPAGDPFVLGTQEPESRPYNPTQLGKDFLGVLQDERLRPHVPRPSAHLCHHDDRERLRRAHRGELPGAREREHDARHLRGRGPGGKEGRRGQGGRELRPGHELAGALGAAGRTASRRVGGPHVHRGTARGHARRGQAEGGRP